MVRGLLRSSVMYGLVNKGFEQMIRTLAGDDGWSEVKARAGVEADVFVTHRAYPDASTVSLVVAAAAFLETTPDDVLERFGVHWVLHTAGSYSAILDATGSTVPEFLVNLPNLHTRVALSFPHLAPPIFGCTDVGPSSLVLHYESRRPGLVPFVVGLLKGLGIRMKTAVAVELLSPGERGERFLVRWASAA
jgi:hypothetical protein